MAELRQSPQERAALKAIWDARPEVIEFAENAEAFAWKQGLKFDAEGLSRMLQEFAAPWIAEHGPLPETGIFVG